jgi:uncharacterized protein (DUF983 family)
MSCGRLAGQAAQVAGRAVRLRCPRCGQTPLFTGWFRMHARCDLCGLVFERAQGYWVGAIYVNYAATALIAVTGAFVLWGHGMSMTGQLALWIPFCVIFPLWFFRYSRSLWLALEYCINPEP